MRGVADEAERWLRQQSPAALTDDVGSRMACRVGRFEGTGPFLWPAGLLAVIGGLLFLASFYSPGELAKVAVEVPLGCSVVLIIGGFWSRHRRRRRIKAGRGGFGHGFDDEAIQRLLDRQRRGGWS